MERVLQKVRIDDQFDTLGHMIREYVSKNWIQTNERYRSKNEKQVYYLSIEFLLGRLLQTNLMNLGIEEVVEEGFKDLGIELDEIEEIESDAGLRKWWSRSIGCLFSRFLSIA